MLLDAFTSPISRFQALALGCLFGGFVWSLIETHFAIRMAKSLGLMAPVTERSAHRVPTPTIGGMAIVDTVLITAIILNLLPRTEVPMVHFPGVDARMVNWLLIGCGAVMALMGLIDDWRTVKPAPKLVVQILCALAPAYLFRHGSWLGEGPLMTMALNFVWIMVVTNIFNFMDGMDGFAGLFTATVASTMAALVIFQSDDPAIYLALGEVLFVSLALIGGSLGFLFHNLPPAKTFMGDVGSQFLGWLLATLMLMAHVPLLGEEAGRALFPATWAPLLLMLPFLGDGLFTMARRALRGENIIKPHFTHLYQRLMKCGRRHEEVLLIEAPVIFGCALLTLALIFVRQEFQPLLGLAGIGLMVGLWLRVRAEETRVERQGENGR